MLTVVPCQAWAEPRAWFGEETINSIVLLERRVDDVYVPHGTGFLLYNYRVEGHVTVVTCAHLLRQNEIYVVVRADTALVGLLKDSGDSTMTFGGNTWDLHGLNLRLRVDLKRDTTYAAHDSLDIAAFPVGLATRGRIGSGAVQYTKTTAITRSSTRTRHNADLGEEVYFAGFPFGIGTPHGVASSGDLADDIPNPSVRSGAIAWLSDQKGEFLLDAFSYGGNSGSPVFTKVSIGKPGPFLIGMIFAHLERGSENVGLARCVWTDDIIETVDRAEELSN